jgi:hypothetical protein
MTTTVAALAMMYTLLGRLICGIEMFNPTQVMDIIPKSLCVVLSLVGRGLKDGPTPIQIFKWFLNPNRPESLIREIWKHIDHFLSPFNKPSLTLLGQIPS